LIDARVFKRLGGFELRAEIRDAGFMRIGGRNGAGKTSLLLCLLGYHKLDDGYVRLNGRDLTSLPIEKRRVVLVNTATFFATMDVERHLGLGPEMRGLKPSAQETDELKELFSINFSGKVGSLSLGQRIRVSLATALLSKPELLLVDEAFPNLSDSEPLVGKLRRFTRSKGIDVIYTSQIQDALPADRVYLMEDGVLRRVEGD
jgi:molybdate/tungstate transport system ATP-binding protein